MTRDEERAAVMYLVLYLLTLAFLISGIVFFWSNITYAKTDDLSEEIPETINVSTEEEKSLTEPVVEVTGTCEDVLEEGEWITYIATAYCPNECCCGKWASIAYKATASGVGAVEGRTIAMDPSYPFGTRIYIEGLGERVCEDRGSAIVGNHIDLYFETHEAACEWGMREVRAYVIEEEKK